MEKPFYIQHIIWKKLKDLCNRLAIIDYGKIIAQGTLNDLISLLDKKETIKIRKSPESLNALDSLEIFRCNYRNRFLF